MYFEDEQFKRHKRYVGCFDTSQTFGWHVWFEACRCGFREAKEVIYIGDGDPWIRTEHHRHFGRATFIIDWFHASEYLWDCGKKLFGEGTKATEKWVHQRLDLLWDGWTKKLLDDLKEQRKKYRGSNTNIEREEKLAYMKALEAFKVNLEDIIPLPLMIEKLVNDRQAKRLIAYGSEAVPILIKLMQDNPPGWMADLIAEVLGEIGDKKALGPLQKELSEWSGNQSALIFGSPGGFGSQFVEEQNKNRRDTCRIISDAIYKIKQKNSI